MIKPLLLSITLSQITPVEPYRPNNPYCEDISYQEFCVPVAQNKNTLEYNVFSQDDIINEENQKILNLLFKEIIEDETINLQSRP